MISTSGTSVTAKLRVRQRQRTKQVQHACAHSMQAILILFPKMGTFIARVLATHYQCRWSSRSNSNLG